MLTLYKNSLIVAIATLSRASILVVTIALSSFFSTLSASEMPVLIGLGGEFTAVSTHNKPITENDLLGKPVLLAFGYTNCADICPITVGYMRNVYDRLTPKQQQQVNFVFVTVDPEYDTPKHLSAYLAHFNSDFIGITGTRAQVDVIVDHYKVDYHRLLDAGIEAKYIRRIEEKKSSSPQDAHSNHMMQNQPANNDMPNMQKQDDEQARLYTHSAHLFIIDKQMQTRALAHTGTPADQVANNIVDLIAE